MDYDALAKQFGGAAAAPTPAPVDYDTLAKQFGGQPSGTPGKRATESEVPGPRQPPSTLSVVSSAPYKAIAGMGDVFLNAPLNVANLAKMTYGTAATALGRPDLAPEVTTPYPRVSELFKKAGLIQPTENMTPGQRILDVGLQAATGAALSPASTGRQLASMALKGGIGGATGQTVTEATGQPVLGVATSMLVPAGLTSLAQARQAQMRAAEQRNAVRDLTVRAAQQEGFLTTPGSITPSTTNVLLERVAGKTRAQQVMAVENQIVTDRLARRAVGIGENEPLTRANMQQIRRQEYNAGYAPLNNAGKVQTDQNFNIALDRILTAYTGPGRSFPNAIPQPVQDLVNHYRVGQFTAADAVGATRTLRDAARTNLSRGNNELGLAQRAISNALEDQIERSLQAANNPNAQAMLEQFRASRQRMAISHSIEDAIVEGGGSVNARTLANDLQTRGRYFSGDLDLIARFANIARPVMTQPGTSGTAGAGSQMHNISPEMRIMMALGGAGGGGAAGGTLGAVAGAALPFIPPTTSALARYYLMSPTGQAGAIPRYDSRTVNFFAEPSNQPMLTNALIGLPVSAPSR